MIATGELSQITTRRPSSTSIAARSGRSVVSNCGNGDFQSSSANCSNIPESNTPSISNCSSLSFSFSNTSGYINSSIYTSATTVSERTPTLISSTFRFVLRTRFRIRAVFVFTESVNPSLEPRRTFSDSTLDTPILGYPLLPILTALS